MIVISEEIGDTVEQHYNRPGLESGVALLNNTNVVYSIPSSMYFKEFSFHLAPALV